MKKPDLAPYLPLGVPAAAVVGYLRLALGLALLVSFRFLFALASAIQELYYTDLTGRRLLEPGAVMPAFSQLLPGVFWGFWAVAALMPAAALGLYLSHYQGGRSIYTMRRLPNRGELWRRCLAVPAATALAALAAVAVLTAVYIKKAVPQLCMKGGKRYDRAMFSTIIRFGLPMGLQQASISFGHVLMQGLINPFGTGLIGGYAAAVKVDTFAVMPIISLGSAMSTFAAQNAGAGNFDRERQGYRTGCLITVVICIALAAVVTPGRMFWMGLFVSEAEYPAQAAEIILMGAGMLAVTPLFYWVLGLIHAALNTMAGAGDTVFSMIAMIAMMLLRVVIAWGFIHLASTDETGIWWAFVLSWIITLLFTQIHYFRGSWKKKALGRAGKKGAQN